MKPYPLLLMLVAAARGASAQPDSNPNAVQPERPTVATHASTAAPGFFEHEQGVQWERSNDGNRYLVAPSNLKIGLTDRAQLNLLVNFYHDRQPIQNLNSFGDFTVGVKYRLLDDNPVLGDFAILPAVKFPSGSPVEGTGTGTVDGSLLLISSYSVGPVAVDLNAGATLRSGDRDAPKRAYVWTASFGFPIVDRLDWVVEFFGFPGTGGEEGITGSAALLTGPVWYFREWISFDAGIITPFTGPQPRATYVGVVWNFGCVVPFLGCRQGSFGRTSLP